MTDACRRCSECEGEEHHWLECVEHPSMSDDDEQFIEEFVGFICKHCEEKAHQCDGCDGPIFPITGATTCGHCDADRDDFEP